MAERFNQQNSAHNSNSITETDFPIVLNRISRLEASQTANSSDDDLIVSLQNRRENCRARQVFEWETIRRHAPAPQNVRLNRL